MWVYVCVYTHIHTLHVGYSDVIPGVGTRHLRHEECRLNESPHTCIRIWVHSTHVNIYIRWESWTHCFFLKKKSTRSERKTENSNLSYIDTESRVLNYFWINISNHHHYRICTAWKAPNILHSKNTLQRALNCMTSSRVGDSFICAMIHAYVLWLMNTCHDDAFLLDPTYYTQGPYIASTECHIARKEPFFLHIYHAVYIKKITFK